MNSLTLFTPCVNRAISCSLRGFEVFLRVPVIIIIRLGKNNALGTIYIDIFQFWGRAGGHMVHLTFFCLLFMKTEKLQEHDQY